VTHLQDWRVCGKELCSKCARLHHQRMYT
jgi:hypothetical protein